MLENRSSGAGLDRKKVSASQDTGIPLSSLLLPIYFCRGLGDFSQFLPGRGTHRCSVQFFCESSRPRTVSRGAGAPPAEAKPSSRSTACACLLSMPAPTSKRMCSVSAPKLRHKLAFFSASAWVPGSSVPNWHLSWPLQSSKNYILLSLLCVRPSSVITFPFDR